MLPNCGSTSTTTCIVLSPVPCAAAMGPSSDLRQTPCDAEHTVLNSNYDGIVAL